LVFAIESNRQNKTGKKNDRGKKIFEKRKEGNSVLREYLQSVNQKANLAE